MKTLIPWQSKYETGIREIDAQHQQLVDILNKLFDAMSVGKGKEILESILDELTNYTVKHFSTEERFMIVYAYPQAMSHKDEHQTLVDEIKKFKTDYAAGNTKISVNLANYLKEWLLNHILGADIEMTQYLREKGLV
jgi:hemerythrin-like metal-binding protein